MVKMRSFDPLTKISTHCVAIFVSRSEDLILVRLYIYLFFCISLIFIILSKRHTVKVSVLTEINIRRVIIISGKCRVAQGSKVLLDSLIHWVILRAKDLNYNE